MSVWNDLEGTASDAWHGKNADGDALAVLADTLNYMPELKGHVPEGKDVKAKVDGWEAALGVPENTGGGNLGNKIGTVAGGLVGSVAGPAGLATGMNQGSKAGGWISDLF